MMVMKSLLFGLVCLAATMQFLDAHKIVCYYTNWSQYRPEGAKFFPENTDASLCTHIVYAFAKMSQGQLAPFEWNDESTDWSKGMYERMSQLKAKNANLKILLAVGGWNMGSRDFSDMVQTDAGISLFVKTSIAFVQKHKFDGLDLDWEYPSNRDGARPTDKQRFSVLIRELKAAYAPLDLLLTAAVGAGKPTIDTAYEIPELAKYLDFINLMTYDLHGSWEPFTGHHAALYPREDEEGAQQTLNVDFAINYWIEKGMPRENIVMGMATYGRGFRLRSSEATNLGAPTTGPGSAGTFTREAGFMAYYEICQKIDQGWVRSWNEEQQVPYINNGAEWNGYDDVESIQIKARYIQNSGLGGAMFWALDLDDFEGKFCQQGPYPLLNAVKSVLSGNPDVVAPTRRPTTTTTINAKSTTTSDVVQTTTVKRPTSAKCFNGDGSYPDYESGCQSFYVCVFTGTQWENISVSTCPANTLFDQSLGVCNHANLVKCTPN